MNRKYIVGALVVICAGVAGWFGMRAVETGTEKAVAEALASVSAQAGEIRYSLLGNTLTLKGVKYSLVDGGMARRGSIDSVEVKGFNRKYVFTQSDAPYNAEDLPMVAESITATGISDSTQFEGAKSEQKVESLRLTGWHQRLGTLLTLHAEHRGDAAFFEELYRCRIDGMEIRNVAMTLTDSDLPPVSISVESMALPEGVQAPGNGKKVSPVTVSFAGIRFSGQDFSGGLRKMEIRDILAPDPAVLAEFFQMVGELEKFDDDEDLRYLAGNKFMSDMTELLLKNYEDRLPVSRVSAEGGSLSIQDSSEEAAKPAVFSMSMKNFDYRLSLTEKGQFRDATNLSGLKMNFPDTMEEYDILARYAPEGLVLNMTSDSLIGDDVLSGRARYEMEGLGVLDGSVEITGDVRALQRVVLEGDPSGDLDRLMQAVRLKGMNVVYKDSGLVPMGVEIAARWNSRSVDDTLMLVQRSIQELAQNQERPVRELAAALAALFDHPGEFSMTMAPKKPMNFIEALSMAQINPDSLPVTFGSKPGERALKDYLPKN